MTILLSDEHAWLLVAAVLLAPLPSHADRASWAEYTCPIRTGESYVVTRYMVPNWWKINALLSKKTGSGQEPGSFRTLATAGAAQAQIRDGLLIVLFDGWAIDVPKHPANITFWIDEETGEGRFVASDTTWGNTEQWITCAVRKLG